jgi:hypothetical protein
MAPERGFLKKTLTDISWRMSPLNVKRLQREGERIQRLEEYSIMRDADAIEKVLGNHNLPPPKAFVYLTAGLNNPAPAYQIGVLGDKTFRGFMPTDAKGYAGAVTVDRDKLYFIGRSHPTEIMDKPYASMIEAHPIQVLKELARRQRANKENPTDPLFVFTYLTGVREGHPMQVGDMGLILDDTEMVNVAHPGQGRRAILDGSTGIHFEAKSGRSVHLEEAKKVVQFSREMGHQLFPAAVWGTPGAPEFQSRIEVGMLDAAYKEARAAGRLDVLAEKIFGEEGPENLSALFDMGITAELAGMRLLKTDEPEFKRIAFALATDPVGGVFSDEVSHDEVTRMAAEKGEAHQRMLMAYIDQYDPRIGQPMTDLSIKTQRQNAK